MSGDNNGYEHGPGHPGGPEEPVQSPWSIRPGAPAHRDDQGAYPDPQQAGYGNQAPYQAGPPPAPAAPPPTPPGPPAAGPQSSGSRRAGSRASNSRRSGGRRSNARGSASGPPGAQPSEPDWNALADRESHRRRRRKNTRFTAVVAAVAVTAAAVVTWLLLSGDDSDDKADKTGPAAQNTPAASPEPSRPTFKPAPTVPPPPGGAVVLADPALDTAPFTPQELFPAAQIVVDGRTYTVTAKKLDNTCSDAANPELGKILRARQCVQMIRVTALSADGTAATVAVGAFANPGDAKTAATEGNSNLGAALLSLPGGPVPVLCPAPVPGKPAVICARQTNSLGRYGVFLIGGYPGPDNRIDPAKGDPKVDQIGNDLDRAVRDALTARGEKRSQAIYDHAKAEAEKAIQGG